MDVIIAGLCNVYTHYITTYEEYQVNVKIADWTFLTEFTYGSMGW